MDLGAVRQNYGLRSFDYGGDPAASGTWRYGVSDSFTLETHAEATCGLAAAGVGGRLAAGCPRAVVGRRCPKPPQRGQWHAQFDLGYSWQNQRFNFGLQTSRTRGDCLDVAALYGSAPPPAPAARWSATAPSAWAASA